MLTDEAHNLAGGALWSSERESQDSTAKRLVLFLQVHHTWAPTPFTCNFWSWSLVLQTCMDSAHLAQSHTQAINQSHPELPHPKRFFMSLLLQADRSPAAACLLALPQPTTRSPAMIRPQLQQSEAMAWRTSRFPDREESCCRFAIQQLQHPFPNKNRSTDRLPFKTPAHPSSPLSPAVQDCFIPLSVLTHLQLAPSPPPRSPQDPAPIIDAPPPTPYSPQHTVALTNKTGFTRIPSPAVSYGRDRL